ncbi:hypothetical protein RAA17_21690 [Komagataeibacter rhaeticus]|nr:hypothetical protein [Komagataeibacter rhaeticus]
MGAAVPDAPVVDGLLAGFAVTGFSRWSGRLSRPAAVRMRALPPAPTWSAGEHQT